MNSLWFSGIGGLLSLIYISGFLVWNLYLANFGFFEHELLQTRFISAGLLTLLLPFALFAISEKIRVYFLNRDLLIQGFVFLIWIWLFATFIFPHVSQSLGGAAPRLASVVAEKDLADDLRTMGVPFRNAGEGKLEIETSRLCQLYKNRDIVLVGVIFEPDFNKNSVTVEVNRVLEINLERIKAFSVLPKSRTNLSGENIVVCDTVRLAYGVNSMQVTMSRLSDILKNLWNMSF